MLGRQMKIPASVAPAMSAYVARAIDASAQALLTEKRKELDIIANQLLEKELILKSDVERLIGKRPFPEKEEFKPLIDRSSSKYEELFNEDQEGSQEVKEEDEVVS